MDIYTSMSISIYIYLSIYLYLYIYYMCFEYSGGISCSLLTRATLMSPGQDETRLCVCIYIYIYIYAYIYIYIYIYYRYYRNNPKLTNLLLKVSRQE